jgi:hypothetical protein
VQTTKADKPFVKAFKTPTPRLIICPISGRELPYSGFGRPPKYAPEVAKERRNKNARDKRAAKNAAKYAALVPSAAS